MPSKPRSRLGTKLARITTLYDITVKQVHAYVRGLHHRIRQQTKTIRKLRRKVANLVKSRKRKTVEVPEENDDDVMKALEKAEQEAKAAEPLDVKAFVDDIKKTAQDFDYQNRYIYEPTSGLYYDPETGYYYNAIYGLHYDGQRGCYLKYNETTGEYDFYSQVMPEEQLEEKKPKERQKKQKQSEPERRRRRSRSRSRRRSRHRGRSRSESSQSSSEEEERRRKRRNKKKKDKVKRKKAKKDKKKAKQESAEEGELDSSSESEDSSAKGRVIVLDSSSGSGSDGDEVATFGANYPDISRKYPPSLRIVVQQTNTAALRKGSLFIVTCKGGSLGREGDHDVIIPDINVSKYHLKFSYDEKKATYRVLDLGSRNGTLLNGARMAPTMQESDPFVLAHGDVLELNQTKLLCHVHDGAITCAKCEPGLLMRGDEIGASGGGAAGQEDGEKIVNPVSHKEGLKLLQKRYGLEDEKFVDPPPQPASSAGGDYTDRAAHRRKTKGSTNEHAKTQAASVDQHIPAENKGFRMLAKLGWSEGQTLGKNDDGLREPIPLVANVGTSGLGSQGGGVATSTVDERKRAIWMRAQERYQACEDVVEDGGEKTEKIEKASLNQQISSGNKGFQLLAKLGWNEGQTLGKNEDGLKEPIGLLTNVGTSGLGSKPLKKPGGEPAMKVGGKEKTIWKKKQEKRKPHVQPVKMFEESDSE